MENKNRVIIYESSSFGGNCRYAHELADAYSKNKYYASVYLVLPSNSISNSLFSAKILLNDTPHGNILWLKIHFILRCIVNPIIFFFWLLRKPRSLVIFNDFEQLFSPIWVTFYKIFLRKHIFCIFLHDPDRDAYPPCKMLSSFSMKCLLKLCKTALYHQYLPEKPYYRSTNVNFVSVPHGIYSQPEPDEDFICKLNKAKNEKILLSILGNIRMEKNYHQAIRCLPLLPECILLIAGKPANSTVDIYTLKHYAEECLVSERIIWYIDYMTESQLSAAITVTDICLLNYLPSFASQSGMINMYAPYRKKLILSDTISGLSLLNREFGMGIFCNPLDDKSFVDAITHIKSVDITQNWTEYMSYASWERQVNMVTDAVFIR